MKVTADDLLRRIPGSVSTQWPMGARFALGLQHGTMSVELYAPRGDDPQTPHSQDELYFIHSGTGMLRIASECHAFGPGTCFFVAAGVEHRFEEFSADFSTWVVFWGPQGGERT